MSAPTTPSGPHRARDRARVAPGSGSPIRAPIVLVPPDFGRQLAAATAQIGEALGLMLRQLGEALNGAGLPPPAVRADSGDPCGDGQIGGEP